MKEDGKYYFRDNREVVPNLEAVEFNKRVELCRTANGEF